MTAFPIYALFVIQVAKHIGSDHHERVLTPGEVFAVLHKIIYHLESYDIETVRSSTGKKYCCHNKVSPTNWLVL